MQFAEFHARHEFETAHTGDELARDEMRNATWKVIETYVDIDGDWIVFTHRVEVHGIDDLMIEGMKGEG